MSRQLRVHKLLGWLHLEIQRWSRVLCWFGAGWRDVTCLRCLRKRGK